MVLKWVHEVDEDGKVADSIARLFMYLSGGV